MREFDLLEHVYAANAELKGGGVLIPPGDDLAMMRLAGGARILAGVDQLVAGRHVNLATTPLHLVGRKAIARSLSDIAAMAAKPLATLVALTLPPDFGEGPATALFDAMRRTAAEYHCPLIGGDIAFHSHPSHPLVCAVTVLSEPAGVEPVTRSGAKPGDDVYVTGALGGSFEPDATGGGCGGRHLTFEPRIEEAIELASILRDNLHAMIDISDGLGRDAMHIAERSNVAVEIEAALIPCRDGLDWRRAMGDGEDYELCFAASGEVPDEVLAVRMTRIGRIVALAPGEKPRCTVVEAGQHVDCSTLGWQHES